MRRTRSVRNVMLLGIVGVLVLGWAAACSSSPSSTPPPQVPGGSPKRGAEAIVRFGCGACHVIPGIQGAVGKVGPPLIDFSERGYIGYFASELEFYLFNETYDSARKKHWQGLDTASPYIGDYQIGITTKEEGVMRRLRNEMEAAGIPIENSKGEWGPGQEEINVRYAEADSMDHGSQGRGAGNRHA